MIDDISTVLNPSYHIAQSLVGLEEIIRVALVRVVLFLGKITSTKVSPVMSCTVTWFSLLLDKM